MFTHESGRAAARRLRRPWPAVALLVLAACGGGATPAKPAATFAKTVKLQPVSGKVLVEVPPSTGFVALSAPRVVPVGTTVNATDGAVAITSASPPPTHFQTGQFHGGIFQISQPRTGGGTTLLTIHDNLAATACGATRGHLSHRILGLLRGTATGGFETVGKFSAATVRGTEYGVRNRCDGTLTVVTEGDVVVDDFHLHKSITLHTGQTYLAKG